MHNKVHCCLHRTRKATMSAIATDETQTAAAEAPGTATAKPAVVAAAPQKNAMSGEYLTFRLGDEEYGIDILRVQEIRSWEQPTRIANALAFIKGVINLRGVIVPVVDLRIKLGMELVEYMPTTAVIVLNVHGRVIGAVVDSVSEVVALGRDDVKPAPELNCAVDSGVITGIGAMKVDGQEKMLILMDIQALLKSCVGLGD